MLYLAQHWMQIEFPSAVTVSRILYTFRYDHYEERNTNVQFRVGDIRVSGEPQIINVNKVKTIISFFLIRVLIFAH